MAVIKPFLVNNEIYHVISRGVADFPIFKDKDDYYRGIFSLYEFNTIAPVTIRERRKIRIKEKQLNRGQTSDNLI